LQQVGGATGVGQRAQKAQPLDRSVPSTPLSPATAFPARRRPLPRSAALGRRLGMALFTALSGALIFSLLTDGGRQTRVVASLLPDADWVLYWTGLRIEQVALSGQRFTADSDVFAAVDLQNAGSLVSYDAAAARQRIEDLPWVATASINRIYPGSLEVRITERAPAALWINDGRRVLIDASGRVLSGVKESANVRLPRFAGAGAPEKAQAMLDLIIRFPRIAERFEMAERVGQRRWTLHLKDNVIVHLGADREAMALAELSSSDDLGKLLEARNVIIDLRTRGRIAVRPVEPDPPQSATQS